MKRIISVLTVAGALVAGTALAQTSSGTSKPTAATKPHAASHTSARAEGKMTQFDASTGMLTLSKGKTTQQFTIADSTRIQEGSTSIDKTALAKLTGHQVTVSYMMENGQKTVQSVHVSNGGSAKKS